MATLFQDLTTTEKDTELFVKVNGDYSFAEGANAKLSAMLNERAVTLLTFVDIYNAGEGAWIKSVKTLYDSLDATTELPSLTVVVILGKKGGDVTDPSSNYATFFENSSVTGFSSIWSAKFVLCYQDFWGNDGATPAHASVGSLLMNGFTYASASEIVTPISYLIGRQSSSVFRVLKKSHMESEDTGNSEYGVAPNPSIVANDIFSFRMKNASGAMVYPDYATVQEFLARRMRDHAGLIGGGHTAAHRVTAAASPASAALDLGAKIAISFSEKVIGADTGNNLQHQTTGAKIDYTNAELSARPQLSLKSTAGGDPTCYLDTAEAATINLSDQFLMDSQAATLSVFLKGDAATPPNTTLKNSNNANLNGPDGANPLLINSFSIGKIGLFMRANLSDNGVHADPLCVSPDISIFHDSGPTSDALRAILSDRTHMEATNDVYSNPGTNHENRLFVRAFNKGTMRARNIKVVLYYAVPSTLILPAQWKSVTNTPSDPYQFFSSPTTLMVDSGVSMAVSEELKWTSNLPIYTPGGGDLNHYCLLAMAGCDGGYVDGLGNPLAQFPTLAQLSGQITTWDLYYAFVRMQNVAWKNIMMIGYGMPSPPPHGGFDPKKIFKPIWMNPFNLKIPFRFPIPPRKEVGVFEITTNMPENVGVGLTVSRKLADNFVGGFDKSTWVLSKDTASMKVGGTDFKRLPRMNIPTQEEEFMVIDVQLSKSCPRGGFPIAFRQLHNGREIGRMTYIVNLPLIRDGKLIGGKGL